MNMPADNHLAMREFLRGRFNPNHQTGLDAKIALDWRDGKIEFSVCDECLEFASNSGQASGDEEPAELVIYFDCEATARRLLSGQGDPMASFVNGEIRSNGYLIWVFHAFAAFAGKP